MSDREQLIRLCEHDSKDCHEIIRSHLPLTGFPRTFKNLGKEPFCIKYVEQVNDVRLLCSAYYVGADWIAEGKVAIYVEPKLNKEGKQIDILQMLVDSMSNPDTNKHVEELFEVTPDKPHITLPYHQDFITPLLMLHFLSVVKAIVRKGLKKSYYPVTENLYCRVKGKVLVSQTIKQNRVKNKQLHTWCQRSEFGVNGIENRILKKALIFVRRYLDNFKARANNRSPFQAFLTDTYNFINPAFESVSGEVELREMKHSKFNPFFKEYDQGLELAQLILKRYGYNINNIKKDEETKVPPFWIDMTKLFELVVLANLKKLYAHEVMYQFKANYGNPDYLILKDGQKMVVDAKYKPQWIGRYDPNDIRQVSGYARDTAITDKLGIAKQDRSKIVPDCLIIYSDQTSGNVVLDDESKFTKDSIEEFVGFYRIGIKLPEVKFEK